MTSLTYSLHFFGCGKNIMAKVGPAFHLLGAQRWLDATKTLAVRVGPEWKSQNVWPKMGRFFWHSTTNIITRKLMEKSMENIIFHPGAWKNLHEIRWFLWYIYLHEIRWFLWFSCQVNIPAPWMLWVKEIQATPIPGLAFANWTSIYQSFTQLDLETKTPQKLRVNDFPGHRRNMWLNSI